MAEPAGGGLRQGSGADRRGAAGALDRNLRPGAKGSGVSRQSAGPFGPAQAMTSTQPGERIDGTAGGAPERLSPVWWLVLPLVLAAGLSLAAHAAPDTYERWVVGERGLLELGQLAIVFAAFLLALRILFLPALRSRPPLAAWVGAAALATLYIAGEEASWGQHFFAWETPAFWAAINDQGETNLHNVSSWLDQKPRVLLEAGVILGGIVIPLAALWGPRIRRLPGAVVLPPLQCLPAAALAEFARLSERILEPQGHQVYPFHRPSEVQELFFYVFILLYLITVYRRVSAMR